MKNLLLTVCLVFLLASVSSAQNITGKLVSHDNDPVVGANVLLLSKADSTFLAGTTTGKDGVFVLANRSDAGILMFSFIGYHSVYYTLDGEENIGTIEMQENEQLLNEARVVGNRIIHNPKGYSIRPSGTGLEDCNTAQELFAFLPGITVDDKEKISLLDKRPIIYVNGMKITQAELAVLVPKNIDKIEVDYLAVGEGATTKGGVIRITTKKPKDGGYAGYLSLDAGAMPAYGYHNSSPKFVFNASTGKWSFNYYAYNTHRQLIGDSEDKYLYDSGLQTNTVSQNRAWSNNFRNRLNISYEINKKSTLAISEYVGNATYKHRQNSFVETILGNGEETEENEIQIYGPESQFVQQTVAKYVLSTDDKGSKLEVTADYYYRNYYLNQIQEDKNNIPIYDNTTQEKTNMFRVQPKYTLNFDDGKELIVGTNYQFIRYNDESDDLRTDADAHTASAYANLSGGTESLMYSAGLTLQYNRMDVHTADDATSFGKLYLCPQVDLIWMIDPEKERMLTLLYQCSVDDMPYSAINGYKNYSTPYHYSTGNPNLQTPTTHDLTARFDLNSNIAVTLMSLAELNGIFYVYGIDPQDENITWTRPENGKYRIGISASAEASYRPAKWWNTKVQVSALQVTSEYASKKVVGQWFGKFFWNNSFRFSRTFGGSLNGYWETGTIFEEYYWEPVGNVKGSLWKTFNDGKIRLSLESTIWAQGRKSMTVGDGYNIYYINTTKPTSFLLSLRWNFAGGKKVKKRVTAESIQEYNKLEEVKE